MLRKLQFLLTRREQRFGLVLLAAMLLGGILEMVGVSAIPAFVALLSDPARIQRSTYAPELLRHFLNKPPTQAALYGAIGLLVIFVIKNSYLAILSFVQSRYVTRRQISIASRLFQAYLRSPYTFHLQRNTAELLKNANSEALDVVGGVLIPCLTLALETFTVGAILVLLFFVEPLISLVAFLLLGGASALFIRVIRRRLLHFGQEIQHYRMKMIQTVTEGLNGIKLTKVLGREKEFIDRFTSEVSGLANATRFRMVMLELPRLYLETTAIIGLLGVAAILLAERRALQAIIPTLSLLAVAIVRMIPSFNRITTALTMLKYGRFSVDAVYNDLRELDTTHRAPIRADVRDLPLTRSLRLEAVSFTYPGAASPSLNSISLQIERGSAVAFVGPTGAGKTTIVDLILGLLEPTQGAILVDGHDLQTSIAGWQRHVGYVPQDVFLTDDTIRRNVAFGLPEDQIDDDRVWNAIRAAQLEEFVNSLPLGTNSLVGERGIRISGGQRQRVGIARALYHSPEVLIFDEATSSLDNETERYVMEAVNQLRGTRTVVIIAHRLTTVRACDKIFLLSNGQLSAEGSYEELLGHSNTFRKLAGAH